MDYPKFLGRPALSRRYAKTCALSILSFAVLSSAFCQGSILFDGEPHWLGGYSFKPQIAFVLPFPAKRCGIRDVGPIANVNLQQVGTFLKELLSPALFVK